MTTYLVRHAKAESRRGWDGPDDLRPLTKSGRRQADALADALAGAGLTRAVTSPSVRCRQTVEPLAERLRIPVELSDAFAEGAPLVEALRQLEKVAQEETVVCTHGDVLGELLDHFARLGVPLDDDRLEKGSTWALDVEDGGVVAARYLPPPALA